LHEAISVADEHDKAFEPHGVQDVPAVFKKCPTLQADTTVAEFKSDAAAEFATPF